MNAIATVITSNGQGCSAALLTDTGCWTNNNVSSGVDSSCILLLQIPETAFVDIPEKEQPDVKITVFPAGTGSFPTSCLVFVAAPPSDNSNGGLSAKEVVVRDWPLDRKQVISGMAAASGLSATLPLQSLFKVANLIGSPQRSVSSSSPQQQQQQPTTTSYPLIFLGLRFVGCTDLSGSHRIRKIRVDLVNHHQQQQQQQPATSPQMGTTTPSSQQPAAVLRGSSTTPIQQQTVQRNLMGMTARTERELSLSPREASVGATYYSVGGSATPPVPAAAAAAGAATATAQHQLPTALREQQQQQQSHHPHHPVTKTNYESKRQHQGVGGGGSAHGLVSSLPASPDTSIIEVEVDKMNNDSLPVNSNNNNNNISGSSSNTRMYTIEPDDEENYNNQNEQQAISPLPKIPEPHPHPLQRQQQQQQQQQQQGGSKLRQHRPLNNSAALDVDLSPLVGAPGSQSPSSRMEASRSKLSKLADQVNGLAHLAAANTTSMMSSSSPPSNHDTSVVAGGGASSSMIHPHVGSAPLDSVEKFTEHVEELNRMAFNSAQYYNAARSGRLVNPATASSRFSGGSVDRDGAGDAHPYSASRNDNYVVKRGGDQEILSPPTRHAPALVGASTIASSSAMNSDRSSVIVSPRSARGGIVAPSPKQPVTVRSPQQHQHQDDGEEQVRSPQQQQTPFEKMIQAERDAQHAHALDRAHAVLNTVENVRSASVGTNHVSQSRQRQNASSSLTQQQQPQQPLSQGRERSASAPPPLISDKLTNGLQEITQKLSNIIHHTAGGAHEMSSSSQQQQQQDRHHHQHQSIGGGAGLLPPPHPPLPASSTSAINLNQHRHNHDPSSIVSNNNINGSSSAHHQHQHHTSHQLPSFMEAHTGVNSGILSNNSMFVPVATASSSSQHDKNNSRSMSPSMPDSFLSSNPMSASANPAAAASMMSNTYNSSNTPIIAHSANIHNASGAGIHSQLPSFLRGMQRPPPTPAAAAAASVPINNSNLRPMTMNQQQNTTTTTTATTTTTTTATNHSSFLLSRASMLDRSHGLVEEARSLLLLAASSSEDGRSGVEVDGGKPQSRYELPEAPFGVGHDDTAPRTTMSPRKPEAPTGGRGGGGGLPLDSQANAMQPVSSAALKSASSSSSSFSKTPPPVPKIGRAPTGSKEQVRQQHVQQIAEKRVQQQLMEQEQQRAAARGAALQFVQQRAVTVGGGDSRRPLSPNNNSNSNNANKRKSSNSPQRRQQQQQYQQPSARVFVNQNQPRYAPQIVEPEQQQRYHQDQQQYQQQQQQSATYPSADTTSPVPQDPSSSSTMMPSQQQQRHPSAPAAAAPGGEGGGTYYEQMLQQQRAPSVVGEMRTDREGSVTSLVDASPTTWKQSVLKDLPREVEILQPVSSTNSTATATSSRQPSRRQTPVSPAPPPPPPPLPLSESFDSNNNSSMLVPSSSSDEVHVPCYKHHVSKQQTGEYMLTLTMLGKQHSRMMAASGNSGGGILLDLQPRSEREMSPASLRQQRAGSAPRPSSNVLDREGVIVKIGEAALRDPALHRNCVRHDGSWCIVLRENMNNAAGGGRGAAHNNLWSGVGGPLIGAMELMSSIDFRRVVEFLCQHLNVNPTRH